MQSARRFGKGEGGRRKEVPVLRSLLASFFALALAAPAGATLLGDTIGCEASGSLGCDASNAQVADPGAEFLLEESGSSVLSVDVSGTVIVLEGEGSATARGSGDGLALRGLDLLTTEEESLYGCGPFYGAPLCEGLPAIESVSVLDGGSGLAASAVSAGTVPSLSIDLAGTSWGAGQSATLELELVPEPGTALLALSGLAALGAARRVR